MTIPLSFKLGGSVSMMLMLNASMTSSYEIMPTSLAMALAVI